MSYPASTGRNTAEVLRVVDSLQTGDKHRVTTPINWIPGDDVIVRISMAKLDDSNSFSTFTTEFQHVNYALIVKVVLRSNSDQLYRCIPPSRMTRLRHCSPNSALSSHTSDSPLSQRTRHQLREPISLTGRRTHGYIGVRVYSKCITPCVVQAR